MVRERVGALERRPRRAAAVIKAWFGPQREELAGMAARAKVLGRPEVRIAPIRRPTQLAVYSTVSNSQ